MPKGIPSPYAVKRMASKIIDKVGTPAKPCDYKSHGQGRQSDVELSKRGKKVVVMKEKAKKTKSEKKAKPSDCKKIIFSSDLDVIDKLKLSKAQIELLKRVV